MISKGGYFVGKRRYVRFWLSLLLYGGKGKGDVIKIKPVKSPEATED